MSEPHPRSSRRRPVERREIEDVARRALALSDADKLELIATLHSYLLAAGKAPALDRQITEREITLAALRQAAEHLGIAASKHPTPAQYDAAARELALGVSRSKIIRAWGSWRLAVSAMAGGPTRETPAQRAIRRAVSGRTRVSEEPLTSVRAWLQTAPATSTLKDYEHWRRAANGSLAEGDAAHVDATGVTKALSLPWAMVIEVAHGTITVQAAGERAEAMRRKQSPDLELVGRVAVANVLGTVCDEITARQVNEQRFPASAGQFRGMALWYRQDIVRYVAGKPRSKTTRPVPDLIGTAELAGLLGRQQQWVREVISGRRHDPIPKAAGRIGQAWVWHRADVERWLEEHPPDKRPRNP